MSRVVTTKALCLTDVCHRFDLNPTTITCVSDSDDEVPHGVAQLDLVTVTLENKRRLFQKAIHASDELMDSTRALMARLEQFDPFIAQHFDFKDSNLALSEAPLRLLSCPKQTKATNWLTATTWLKGIISSSEPNVDRSNLTTRSNSHLDRSFDSFICLSYCWHKEDWTTTTSHGLHEEWPITEAMLRAFLDQRNTYDEGVWIDALCIDQNNATEKMHAIGSMDMLYKSARAVYIILEDIILPREVCDTIKLLLLENPDLETVHECLPKVWKGTHQMLSSRWFKRAWCWHELQLAAEAFFLIPVVGGSLMLSLLAFVDLQTISTIRDDPRRNTVESMRVIERLTHMSPYRTSSRIDYPKRTPMSQFNSIINLSSSFETDKISIAANIAGLQIYYKGPQMSNNQCRWIISMLALCAGDLSILCGTGPAIQMTNGINRPSWLRWWDDLEDLVFATGGPKFPKRPSIISISQERIILDLLVLEHYSYGQASAKSFDIAKTILERYAEVFDLEPLKKELDRSDRDMIRTLACSLDCGLQWLTESMTVSHHVADGVEWWREEDKHYPLVPDLLIQAYPDQESTISSLTFQQKRSAYRHIYYNLHFSGRGPLDSQYASGLVTSTLQVGNRNPCCRLDWGTACGKALTFVQSPKFTRCCLAVPVALGDSRWSAMDRLWLLKPLVSPTGSHWTIIEKIKFTTPRPLEEEGGLVLRAAQTIRG
jgi:Heterokaryon incompatibility protein (HET)